MRAVVQRVRNARVEVDAEVVGAIDRGLLIYLGVRRGDNRSDVKFVSNKVVDLRIFPDEEGKMNLSLADIRAATAREAGPAPGVLVVSQFTLYGDVRKGRRPSYNDAAPPETAKDLYDAFLAELAEIGVPPQSGVFQEHMDVIYTNDGPVTILIETGGKE